MIGEREIVLYPPEYAGGYIDEFNNLHIVLTKNADYATTRRNYQEIMCTDDEEIIYDVADFPLSRLYEVQRTLDKVMFEFDISATGINEFTNRLDINIEKGRELDVVEFLKSKFDDFDEKCIVFDDPADIRLTVGDGVFGEGKTVAIICLIVVVLALTVCAFALKRRLK